MEYFNVTAIVLNSIDYGEKDKLITLFSLELGKITAKLRGVKSDKAKLKFAGQPFCFGDWILEKSKENYIVTACSIIDSFYDITLDYDKMVFGSNMLSLASYSLKPNIISENLFISLIKCLKNLVYSKIESKLILIKFLEIILEFNGISNNYQNCTICGKQLFNGCYINKLNGGICCEGCSNNNSDMFVSRQELSYLKLIKVTDIDKIITIKISSAVLDSLLKLYIISTKALLDYDLKF